MTEVELKMKMDSLYTKIENDTVPVIASRDERIWNDGFYRGQCKAMELVCEIVFGCDGDDLL